MPARPLAAYLSEPLKNVLRDELSTIMETDIEAEGKLLSICKLTGEAIFYSKKSNTLFYLDCRESMRRKNVKLTKVGIIG